MGARWVGFFAWENPGDHGGESPCCRTRRCGDFAAWWCNKVCPKSTVLAAQDIHARGLTIPAKLFEDRVGHRVWGALRLDIQSRASVTKLEIELA